jgi:hypothetical protein
MIKDELRNANKRKGQKDEREKKNIERGKKIKELES